MGVYAYRGCDNLIEAISPRLEEAGWRREGEPELADMVITYFPTMNDLEDLCFGDNGLMQVMKPGSMIVDLSSVTPNFAREMNAIATLSDLKFVEAPLVVKDMTLADAFARDNIFCFASGEDGCVVEAKDLLDAIFCEVKVVGGGGAAQLMRAANTLQTVAGVISAIEAHALFMASKRSISSIEMGEIQIEFSDFGAQAIIQAIRDERFDSSFTCEMLMGELSAAIMAADDYELIMPQAESAMHLLELLAVIGGADKAPVALALVYGEEAACAANGLDWSRAETLYAQEDGIYSEDDYDDAFDDYDDSDDSGSIGFGYSVN
ncbi:NAD(P)-binding domain-containing protein [Adlercreutzia sp. ZJ304]|uniref:NAD(P)-binding domain-containing protein n=1 Tax=Adlercreutzia sp. ZJ304 TaxID=2709791 RepID=UPI0013EA176F|nr:NAD(P)-binding domain-containing protein [Adlercreutzia sp. ZJ304]